MDEHNIRVCLHIFHPEHLSEACHANHCEVVPFKSASVSVLAGINNPCQFILVSVNGLRWEARHVQPGMIYDFLNQLLHEEYFFEISPLTMMQAFY